MVNTMTDYDKKAKDMMDFCNKDSVLVMPNGKTIQFARADESDWERIKRLSNKELRKKFKSKCISVEYCAGIIDYQILALLGNEMEKRGLM